MNSRRRRQMRIWPSRAQQWIKPETAGQQAIGDRGAERPPLIEGRRAYGALRRALGRGKPMSAPARMLRYYVNRAVESGVGEPEP